MEADVCSVNTECQVFACSRLKIINYFPHCLAAVRNKLHLDHKVGVCSNYPLNVF
jgi:hypothetical protein